MTARDVVATDTMHGMIDTQTDDSAHPQLGIDDVAFGRAQYRFQVGSAAG